MIIFADPPKHVDRLIVHQFDPVRPSPGGIDTCLRGIIAYLPKGTDVAIVGVDVGNGPTGRRLGQWEYHSTVAEQGFWFLPVAGLDPADQARRIPHSLRLMLGFARYRRRIPSAGVTQVHRMDSALTLRVLHRGPQTYFVHTQDKGLTHSTSDSLWRFAGAAHRLLERAAVQRAETVVVFNESYSSVVRGWNRNTLFSPTWYDPALIGGEAVRRLERRVIWVGRLEAPKDPGLAIETVNLLLDHDCAGWELDILGSGTLLDSLRRRVAALDPVKRDRVHLLGRVDPSSVAQRMATSGTFLMTSHPGYEGYPRVLVEAMASGLPAVVTLGSDTGGLVIEGETGFTCSRDPRELADAILKAQHIDRRVVAAAVRALDAPSRVREIFEFTTWTP